MSKRGDIPLSIPDVVIPYSLGALSKHPEYVAAKAGSVESAIKLAVIRRLRPSEISSLQREMKESASKMDKLLGM